jgi:hypothetical protein
MTSTSHLIWDDERVGVKDGCVLFMAHDGDVLVAGAVDSIMLKDMVPAHEPFDPIAAFGTVAPALKRAVSAAYRMGQYEEIWDAPGILRHRRVLVRIGLAS